MLWGRYIFWSCKFSNYKSWQLYRGCILGLDSCSSDGYDILQRGLVGNVWLPIWDPDIKLYEPEVLRNRVLGKRMSSWEKIKGGSPWPTQLCTLSNVPCWEAWIVKSGARRERTEVWMPRRRPQDQDRLYLGRGLSLSSSGNKPFWPWVLKCISLSQLPLPGFFLFFSAISWRFILFREQLPILPSSHWE